ncbi:retinol dehydrogenase 11-like isoform X1 [Portunus trituberculatus]|uniref:retinol dehydrogenase 11-like isoform X1 n=1 Tax=Portunus trituberculatus TaxID=210409 RepID=UPI001E1D03E2|nr:retinol dehydrogenase 11-like isoform X1 [Portunus trituberculatus]
MTWTDFVEWLDQNKVVLIAVTCSVVGAGGCLVGLRAWLQGPMCKSKARLDGKTVVITGSNTGIGKETARDLSRRGARVVMLCRDLQKARTAAEEINRETGNAMVVHHLDLASLESVRNTAEILADTEQNIHILINNAGIMMCPRWETKDGFEMQLGTNHLGHFLLTMLLLDRLKASAPARIINVSSIAHTQGKMHWDDLHLTKDYNAKAAYCQSKLANVLFTRELAKKLKGTNVNAYSLHPGVVQTDLGRHIHQSVNGFIHWAFHFFGNFFFKTVKRGAQTTIYCAVEESLATQTGKYYSDCAEKQPHQLALCDDDARRLWDVSSELVGLGV